MDYDGGLADRLKAELMLPAREEGIRIGELAIDRLTGEIRLPDGPVPLTVREKEVLKLLSIGLSNRQIAGRLGVTERTAVFHVGNLLRKLGLSSRVEAALVARWLQD
jgi:DNA-binding CsgD family transcriptional regulator